MPISEKLICLVFLLLLIVAAYTDLTKRLIPDSLIWIGIFSAVIFRLFHRPFSWWNYVLTFLLAILFFAACAAVTSGKAIGGGDVKLFGMIALGFGMTPFLVILFVSHLCATVFLLIWKVFRRQRVNKDTTFPFAPFLLIGFCFHIFLYYQDWYNI